VNNFIGRAPATVRRAYFTNKTIHATKASRAAIHTAATTAALKTAVIAAIKYGVLAYDPYQHDTDQLPNFTRPTANYLGMHKVFVLDVEKVNDDGSAVVTVCEQCEDCEVLVVNGVQLENGDGAVASELVCVAGQYYLTVQAQRTDSIANAVADITSRLAAGCATSLTKLASGANTAIAKRRVKFGNIGGVIHSG